MVRKKIYCFDTSALFDAGIRWYPPDVFPSFWERLGKLVEEGRLFIPSIVAEESTRQTHIVGKWVKEIKKNYSGAIVEPDEEIQRGLRKITQNFRSGLQKAETVLIPL